MTLAVRHGWMGVVLAAFLFQLCLLSWSVDDAYISLRYAENLASGAGLVFNPGERVEGYSNFLWVLVLALLSWMGIPVLYAAKFLGIGSFHAVLWYCVKFFRLFFSKAGWTGFPAWLAPAFLTFNGVLIYYSMVGLETAFVAFLVLAAAYHLLRHLLGPSKQKDPVTAGCLLAMAALTRPEGLLFTVLGFLFLLWHRRRMCWSFLRETLSVAGPALLVAAGYTLFRHAYFGDWLPNTYYAKSFGALHLLHLGGQGLQSYWTALGYGLRYTGRFLLYSGGVLPLLLLGYGWQSLRFEPRLCRAAAFLLILVVGYALVFVIPVGGDWMILHRFYAPVLAPLFLSGSLALAARLKQVDGRWRVPSWTIVSTWLACMAMALAAGWEMTHFTIYSNRVTTQKQVGLWLLRHAPHDATVVVNEVGAIPFYSQLRTIDTSGLTDRRIARIYFDRQDFWNRWSAEILDRRPEYILIPAKVPLVPGIEERATQPDGRAFFDEEVFYLLFIDPRFQEKYTYWADFSSLGDRRTIFKRRDLF